MRVPIYSAYADAYVARPADRLRCVCGYGAHHANAHDCAQFPRVRIHVSGFPLNEATSLFPSEIWRFLVSAKSGNSRINVPDTGML